jgi:hypothetical protein
MSFLNQSGALSAFSEVVPDAARVTGLTRSSILSQRRRCRISPQSGQSYGSSGAGGGNAQLQFLIADQGGLIDPRSIVLNYFIQTSGTGNEVPDDGHPFTTCQVLMNGQLMDNIQNAMKYTNIEMKMGGSRAYYQSAGSLQGFELLNNDLITTLPVAGSGSLVASDGQFGYVSNNVADINARTSRAAAAVTNNIAGEPRSLPLGLISGVGRMKSYLPVSLLGELSIVLITGTASEVIFNPSANVSGDYSLAQVTLEYDVVVPAPAYMSLLQKIASDPSDSGVNLPFESAIVTAGAAISSSSTLAENSVIVSRATNHLLRAHLVQIPTTLLASVNFPSQSCFGHAGVWSVQFRIGSQTYPQVACQGDAALFNMSLEAYGSVSQENGTVVNRMLWGNSTDGATAGTPAVYETANAASGGTVKFAYADSFIPSYGFQTVKGASAPLDVDGVSLAGASGSQIIATVVQAPAVAYTPFLCLVALKFIKASGGSVQIIGA